jgi:hypothetical protein
MTGGRDLTRIALDGGAPATLNPGLVLPGNVSTIVLTSDEVVFTSADSSFAASDAIYALPKSGGDMRRVVPPQGAVSGLSWDGTTLFWISRESSTADPSFYRSSIRSSPISGTNVTTLIAEDNRAIQAMALTGDRVYWFEISHPAGGETRTASMAKDGTDARTEATACYAWFLSVRGSAIVCASHGAAFQTDLNTGATASLARYPGDPEALVADSKGAFLIIGGYQLQSEDSKTYWSSIIDVSTGRELAHAELENGLGLDDAFTLDENSLYWGPFVVGAHAGVFRVRRR